MELMTKKELMEYTKFSGPTIFRLQQKGILKPIYLSARLMRFDKADVDKLLEERKMNPPKVGRPKGSIKKR